MTKRFGFTLAEVLITLGIIGVVAAMTIPTLISNTNGAQFKTAYKKALSTLNQAVVMNVALDDTDFSTLVKASGTSDSNSNTMVEILTARMQSATDVTTSYYAKTGAFSAISYQGADHTCVANDTFTGCSGQTAGTVVTPTATTFTPSATAAYVYSFADGTTFGFNVNAEKCTDASYVTNNCVGFIDVNGATGPNTVINCADAANGNCEASEITDIFPVYFHGQTVEPATKSARAVLFGK